MHLENAESLQNEHDYHGILGPDRGNGLHPLDTILHVDRAGFGRGTTVVNLVSLVVGKGLAVLHVSVPNSAVVMLGGSAGRHITAWNVPVPSSLCKEMRVGVVGSRGGCARFLQMRLRL